MPSEMKKLGRTVKANQPTTVMHVNGKSDEGVVPLKSLNKPGRSGAVVMEGRPLTEGNLKQPIEAKTQCLDAPSLSGLQRIRKAARDDKGLRFTALFHHITPELLGASYEALDPHAASGIDGVTWAEYGEDVSRHIVDLHRRLHAGSYRAQPSRRVWIPKADGKQRPLGIAALEDKIVQRAVGTILETIYETDFAGFSYGFRPGRSQCGALDALWTGLTSRPVNWILDADIKSFFDTLDHQWLMKFVSHRIADRRIHRLIQKWLKAGVCEEGTRTETTQGVPQGAVISPLLANLYLHHVFDLWVKWWRKHEAQGEVIVVRYADDTVIGFQSKPDAERFLGLLKERFGKFSLELHPDKTRLIEFGKFATANRRRRQEGKPETFAFLGFTHIAGKRRSDGGYTVLRHSIARRVNEKIAQIREHLLSIRSTAIKEQGKWLGSVVGGWLNYHAIPTNSVAIARFRWQIIGAWRATLRRRSQTAYRTTGWRHMRRLAEKFLPPAIILHPYPNRRHVVTT